MDPGFPGGTRPARAAENRPAAEKGVMALKQIRAIPLLCLAICWFLISLPGCMYWLLENKPRMQYVLDKGNAEEIAKWTKKQDEGWKLFDGLNALRYRMVTTHDGSEAYKAMACYIQVFQLIEDWPVDRTLPNSPHDDYTTRNLVSDEFFLAASDAYDSSLAEELLHRLRPDANHAQWLGEWEQSVAHLQQDRQDARDIAAGKPLKPLTTRPGSP